MKKIFLFLSFMALLSSCSDDSTGDVSRVTYYPELTLIGDEVIIVQKGASFTDPGVIATEGGVEIDYATSVTGSFRGGTSIDTNVVDIYNITYSAVNQDGFSGTISRTVIVVENGNLINDISGLYSSTVVRNGVVSAQYTDMEYVLIWKNNDGSYEMSDGIGGYYAIGRSYGNDYAARPVILTPNDTNEFIISDFSVGAFGGVAVMNEFTVNAPTKTISFSTDWDAGFVFNVTLTQVEF